MNKKLLAIALAAFVAVSLSACGPSAEEQAKAAKQEQQKKGLDALYGDISSKSVKRSTAKEQP